MSIACKFSWLYDKFLDLNGYGRALRDSGPIW